VLIVIVVKLLFPIIIDVVVILHGIDRYSVMCAHIDVLLLLLFIIDYYYLLMIIVGFLLLIVVILLVIDDCSFVDDGVDDCDD